jgi:heat shock protein beta
MIKTLSRDEEKYARFFARYGDYVKLGVIEDHKYRKKLAKLLRFKSTTSPKEYVSLDEYVSRMKKGQKQIFFSSGQDIESIMLSPSVENAVDRGFEVLYFVNPVDEYMVNHLTKYMTFRLQNVGKDGVEYDEVEDKDDKAAFEALTTSYKPLTEFLKESLGDYVESVKISKKLTKAPCAVLAQYMAASGAMERILRAQAIANKNKEMQDNLNQRKVFDLNPVGRGAALLAPRSSPLPSFLCLMR